MLLAQTLRKLLILWSQGKLSPLPIDLTREIPLILTQVLIRTLYSQNKDGSWGQSCETSSFALLTLIDFSPSLGLRRLSQKSWKQFKNVKNISPRTLTYGSGLLSQAYCIAAYNEALNLYKDPHSWSPELIELTNINETAVQRFTKCFSKLTIFSQVSEWAIQASIIEGYQFLTRLDEARHMVFPRKNMAKDSYLEYIPITWTICNNYSSAFLSNELLWDIMTVSMLNYQVDEFMETTVHDAFKNDLESAKCIIRRIIVQSKEKFYDKPTSTEFNYVTTLTMIWKRSSSIFNPKIHPQGASVAQELETFIMAHLDQIHDNRVLGEYSPLDSQPREVINFSKPGQTYFDWAHMTSAAHTSCLYSFSYFPCLISSNTSRHGSFSAIQQKYLAQDLRRHLAAMCRQYNDLGSVNRDRLEQNLNSINFPEFNFCGDTDAEVFSTESTYADETQRKAALYQMAEHERACMSTAFKELSKTLDNYTKTALQVFVDVTDLYGQIYVARDIASRMR
ncbi:hypothetical protein BOTCAL_0263g00060 [Botryotinia calthae]|uniref:Uncharacterized protein n=1 Tax=Botryotinia calthae TaxID=38488 RepID=A0A4Y8CW03_9HELO|nr:hypothetical protein BOTCAL_0263g00060 [Botryotinia calthae]